MDDHQDNTVKMRGRVETSASQLSGSTTAEDPDASIV
jgi:hypothetical protein